MFAADHQKTSMVEYILRKVPKVNVWAKDSAHGDTILHHAVRDKNLELASLLYALDAAQCLAQNYEGKSAYHLAVETEQIEMLQVFKGHQ